MREVEARLKISAVDRTGRVLSNVGNKLDAVNKKTLAVNRMQSAMLDNLRYLATAVIPAAAAYEMIRATEKAADFQEALFKIEKKSGATKEQMAKLAEEVKSLFTEMPVKNIDEMAAAFERGAAAGIPLDDLKEFARLTIMVSDGWDTAAEETGNFISGFNKGMKIPMDKMEAFTSLINDLADSGIADERDIADFIDRAGAGLMNFGLTPEEIAAYGASFLNLKIPAEVAARAMDTLSGKLLAPENLSPKARTALTAIVGDLKGFSKLAGNEKMMRFLKSLQGMTNQRKASLLGALLGEGFDDEIMRAVNGLDEIERNLKASAGHVANNSHSVTALYVKQQELFNKQWQVLKNNLAEVEQSFGERLLPLATKFVEEMNKGFKAQRELAKGAEVISGGSRKMYANTRAEWARRYKELGFTNEDGTKGAKAEWEAAVKARGKGSKDGGIDSEFAWLSMLDRKRYGRQYSGGAQRRFANGRKTGNLAADWLGADKSVFDIKKGIDILSKYETMMRDLYRQGNGRIPANNKVDTWASGPARLAATLGDPSLAGLSPLRRGTLRQFDKRRGSLQDTKDAGPQKPFSLIEAMRMDMPYGGKSSNYEDSLKELSRLSLSLGEGGQKVAQGGDEAGQALIAAGQQFAQMITAAAAQAAQALSNVKVNVNATPTVNANTGQTNTFARSPGTGHQ